MLRRHALGAGQAGGAQVVGQGLAKWMGGQLVVRGGGVPVSSIMYLTTYISHRSNTLRDGGPARPCPGSCSPRRAR
jgi:hypothetical protein